MGNRNDNLAELARLLTLIATRPNYRERPVAGDLEDDHDAWFDGGAMIFVTGYTRYEFNNGASAIMGVVPWLSLTVTLPDGTKVGVSEDRDAGRDGTE